MSAENDARALLRRVVDGWRGPDSQAFFRAMHDASDFVARAAPPAFVDGDRRHFDMQKARWLDGQPDPATIATSAPEVKPPVRTHEVTFAIFLALREAIPSLPEHATRVVLTLDANRPPVIRVTYFVPPVHIEGIGALTTALAQFEVKPREPKT